MKVDLKTLIAFTKKTRGKQKTTDDKKGKET